MPARSDITSVADLPPELRARVRAAAGHAADVEVVPEGAGYRICTVSGDTVVEMYLEMRPDGSVNDNAEMAAVGQFLMAVLEHKTVEPVLLLEGNREQPGQSRVVPVRMVDLAVKDDAITLAVEMMTAPERQAWLQRLGAGNAAGTSPQ